MTERLKESVVIALEGLDGAGKRTQQGKLGARLGMRFGAVTMWAEPNDKTIPGARIRRILRKDALGPKDPFEFQRLYVLDRGLNILQRLEPALAQNEPVVIDRYALSTLAYGMLSGRPAEDFVRLHREVLGPYMRWPHLSIYIDVPVEECLARLAQRAIDRGMENPQLFDKRETLTKVAANYLTLCVSLSANAARPPALSEVGQVRMVTGRGTPDEVAERIASIVDIFLQPFVAEEQSKGAA